MVVKAAAATGEPLAACAGVRGERSESEPAGVAPFGSGGLLSRERNAGAEGVAVEAVGAVRHSPGMPSLGSEDNGMGVGAHLFRPGVERGAQAGVACSCVPNCYEQRGEARDQQEMCAVHRR